VPSGADWKEIPVGDGSFLEHADPEAWFSELVVPFGGNSNSLAPPFPPISDVVTRVREDFASILFTDDVAWNAGSDAV
jgi:hypothetical protein